MSRKVYCGRLDCRHCYDGLCACHELFMDFGEKVKDDSKGKDLKMFCLSMDLVSQKEKINE